jgi:Rod binding domain-containing protein
VTITQISTPAAPDQPAAAATKNSKDSLEKLHDAATQFESLLIGDMLRSVRESGGGWMGGEDQSAGSIIEMAEQRFAQLLAAGGGLGMAKLVTEGLAKAANRSSADAQPSAEFSSSAIRKAYSVGI